MPLIAEATETACANEALGHLGVTPILSIDSGSDFKSKTCAFFFPIARDALQRRYPWNFCEARASLVASATLPGFGFTNSFPLPEDCLAVREIPCAGSCDKWRVVGRAIYTNLPAPLQIVYTRRTPEVAKWDPLYRIAFGFSLAGVLARPIAKDAELAKEMKAAATDAAEDAFPTDAAEGNDNNEAPMQDIIAARF
jgi:hypothetical protein